MFSPWIFLTLVRKNSEDELRSALKEETWMNRSTSYLATASAIRSAPSTWTSSKSKFLKENQYHVALIFTFSSLLGGVVSADEIVNYVGVSNALFQRLSISEIVFLGILSALPLVVYLNFQVPWKQPVPNLQKPSNDALPSHLGKAQ